MAFYFQVNRTTGTSPFLSLVSRSSASPCTSWRGKHSSRYRASDTQSSLTHFVPEKVSRLLSAGPNKVKFQTAQGFLDPPGRPEESVCREDYLKWPAVATEHGYCLDYAPFNTGRWHLRETKMWSTLKREDKNCSLTLSLHTPGCHDNMDLPVLCPMPLSPGVSWPRKWFDSSLQELP